MEFKFWGAEQSGLACAIRAATCGHSFIHFISFRFVSFHFISSLFVFMFISIRFMSCHVISFRFVRSFVHAFLAFSRRISCACCSPWKCAECVVPFVSTPPFHSLLFPFVSSLPFHSLLSSFRFNSYIPFVTASLCFKSFVKLKLSAAARESSN